MLLKATIIFIFLHLNAFAPLQNEWKQLFVKNRITVSSKDVPGSAYLATRAEMVVNTDLDRLMLLLNNFEAYPQLIHNCTKAKLIKRNDDSYIVHLTLDAPWPLTDRDVYLKMDVKRTAEKNIIIELNDAKGFEPVKGLVRIEDLNGRWVLDRLGTSQVKVVLEIHMNPSGNIPAWIANNSADDQVYYTLLNARDRIMR